MPKTKIATLQFSKIYPLYVQKAERKNRTQAEVDEIIRWLTGYDQISLVEQAKSEKDLHSFFADAPQINPNAELIKGVVCGVRVEDFEDPVVRHVRYMDKLIDELARGKAMEKILRS